MIPIRAYEVIGNHSLNEIPPKVRQKHSGESRKVTAACCYDVGPKMWLAVILHVPSHQYQ